jgi:hypothetical protein
MGIASGLNSSIPSALIGFHRPLGSVSQQTSFHLQRCRVRIIRTISAQDARR